MLLISRNILIPVRSGLNLDADVFLSLLKRLGPSLGLWRGAEVAVLRACSLRAPILDLGCGDGIVTSLLGRRIDLGVDPHRPSLFQAARWGCYSDLRATAIETAGLPPATFSTILSNSVLEHIANIDEVLAAVSRALRPDGVLVMTCPSHRFSRSLLLPIPPYTTWRNRVYQHHNLWTTEEWTRRLDAAGLTVESVQYYLEPHWVRLWDSLEVLQAFRGVRRGWQRIPLPWIRRLAERASQIELAAGPNGGGCCIVARKR